MLKITGGVRHLFPYHRVVISGQTRSITARSLVNDTITLDSALSGAPGAGVAVSYDTLWIGLDLTQALWARKDGSAMDFYQTFPSIRLPFNRCPGLDYLQVTDRRPDRRF